MSWHRSRTVPARSLARDPRLVVLPVVGVVLGVAVALFLGDLPAPPPAAARVALVPPIESASPTPTQSETPRARRVARPTRIRIPTIDVAADIRGVGLNRDGSMEVPPFGLAGWYTNGAKPGQPGPAVVVAHVDSYKGPDVFFRLRELRRGDPVVIRRADGTKGHWSVLSSEQTDKDELPVDRIWNDTRKPVLRLVTCGGDFNEAIGHYDDNVTVYLRPVDV